MTCPIDDGPQHPTSRSGQHSQRRDAVGKPWQVGHEQHRQREERPQGIGAGRIPGQCAVAEGRPNLECGSFNAPAAQMTRSKTTSPASSGQEGSMATREPASAPPITSSEPRLNQSATPATIEAPSAVRAGCADNS